tara:strand:- start:6629 stop:6865 length:237 start_codon:yes stop_codon:yes gene_type:complete
MWNKFTNFVRWALANDTKIIKEPVKEPKVSIKDEEVYEKVRTRTVKGRYKADNKSTPEVNEAWTTKKVAVKRVSKKKK